MNILQSAKGAWEAVRYAGTGGVKDITSPDYQGGKLAQLAKEEAKLNHIDVREATHDEDGDIWYDAQEFVEVCRRVPCPFGLHQVSYQDKEGNNKTETHSCNATSVELAPDGCSYEGRAAICHDGSKNISNCPDDYPVLKPVCVDTHMNYAGNVASYVAAAAGVVLLGRFIVAPVVIGAVKVGAKCVNWFGNLRSTSSSEAMERRNPQWQRRSDANVSRSFRPDPAGRENDLLTPLTLQAPTS